jgi:hypothetical protein
MQDSSQPSTANIAVACALIAGVTGYMLGQAKSLGFFGGSPVSTPAQRKEKPTEESDESSDEDNEDSEDDTAPAEFPGHNEECKMVLVIRTDLGMTKGMRLYLANQEHADISQAKLAHNADTRHSLATSTFLNMLRNLQYYNDGRG